MKSLKDFTLCNESILIIKKKNVFHFPKRLTKDIELFHDILIFPDVPVYPSYTWDSQDTNHETGMSSPGTLSRTGQAGLFQCVFTLKRPSPGIINRRPERPHPNPALPTPRPFIPGTESQRLVVAIVLYYMARPCKNSW